MRFTNAKLNRYIITKLLLDADITSIDIDILLCLVQYQNAYGYFDSVYYRNIVDNLHIVKQSFYNSLYKLDKLGYITLTWENSTYWKGNINNNIFATKSDDSKGYMRTNIDLLYSDKFRNLKVNEKKIILKLLMDYRSNKGLKVSPTVIGNWINISNMQLIDSYLKNIQDIFPCHYIDGKKGILVKFHDKTTFAAIDTEANIYLRNKLYMFCKVNKVKYTYNLIEDIVILLKQYKDNHLHLLIDTIYTITKQIKILSPSIIHKFFREALPSEPLQPESSSIILS